MADFEVLVSLYPHGITVLNRNNVYDTGLGIVDLFKKNVPQLTHLHFFHSKVLQISVYFGYLATISYIKIMRFRQTSSLL